MKYPTWKDFETKYSENPRGAFESLCRMLFSRKYSIADTLPYFYNNAGNETNPVEIGVDTIGFQAKYFSGTTFDNNQAGQIKQSIERAHAHYPKQNKIVVYSNLVFGNPPAGKTMTERQKDIEDTARNNSMEIEWVLDANILDIVAQESLIYNLFFNLDVDLIHLDEYIENANNSYTKSIQGSFLVNGEERFLDRTAVRSQMDGFLFQGKNVVLVGESGCGKSAIAKSYLAENKGASIIWLNASQFDTDNISNLFHLEKSFTMEQVRQYYQSGKGGIIVIDAAEKLLEIKNKMPLMLFVSSMSQDDWQFVFTSRKSAVERLSKLLHDILQLNTESVEVPLLTDEELNNFLQANSITRPNDERLYDRIHNLFYLARYAEVADGTQLSLTDFRTKVWDVKIRGEENYSLAQQEQRESVVLELARRALQNDGYYIKADGLDMEALVSLVQDDIICKGGLRGYYFAHDIYRDWAMDFHADAIWEEENDVKAYVEALGDGFASVNTFRRWYGRAIENGEDYVTSFTDAMFRGELKEAYQTAVITEVFRSKSFAKTFFQKYNDALTANDYQWAIKVLKLLPVVAKKVLTYISYQGAQYPLMRPIGSGWDNAVEYIAANHAGLMRQNAKAVHTILTDYPHIQGGNKETLYKAGLLVLQPHRDAAEMRKRKEDIFFQNEAKACKEVSEYFLYIHEEMREIMEEVISNKWVSHLDPYYELSNFIVKAEGETGLALYIFHPKEVLALMDLFWCEQDVDKKDDPWGSRSRHMEPEPAWGLSERRTSLYYFPASALQTCISRIIIFHPEETLNFIISFVDKGVNRYAQNKWMGDEEETIELMLPDGTTVTKKGNQTIWNIYRGTTGVAVPHVLESIHMALESYLLQDAKNGNKEEVRRHLWTIIRSSQSFSLIAIVASIVTAYPDDFIEEALLMTSNLQFMKYDLMRYSHEISIGLIDFAFHHHPNMLTERRNSNALKHRQQHLETLLFNIQVAYQNATEERGKQILQRAYNNVDLLKVQLQQEPDDEKVLTKFIISRCDIRSMKVENVEVKGQQGLLFYPNLDEEQKQMSEASVKNSKDVLTGSTLRMWASFRAKGELDKIKGYEYEGHPEKALSAARDILEQLRTQQGGLTLLPGDEYVPSAVCAVLIRDFADKVPPEDFDFCIDVVVDALEEVGDMVGSRMSEYGICLDVLGKIIERKPAYKERCLNILRIYACITHEAAGHRPCDIVAASIALQNLWGLYGDEMKSLVLGFIDEKTQGRGIDVMEYEDAESLLCLLSTYPKAAEMQRVAEVGLERLSHIWDMNDKRKNIFIGSRHEASDVVARVVLNADKSDIPRLLTFFARYLNTDHNDTFLMAFVLRTVMTGNYENFWTAWNALYDTVVNGVDGYLHSERLNNYMLNPVRYSNWGDDWFRLEKKDMAFFQRIATDKGGVPAVLRNVSYIGRTLAKNYGIEILDISNSIVVNFPHLNLKDYEQETLANMEAILRGEFMGCIDQVKKNPALHQKLLNVVDFMIARGSSYAADFKTGI